MNKYSLVILISLVSFAGIAQNITAKDLLAKSIKYHDPKGVWKTFQGTLYITMETPDKGIRKSEVTFNFPANYFKLFVTQDGSTYEEVLDRGECRLAVQGRPLTKDANNAQVNCESTIMMKNYYTYLYGLPMKLQDKGTILHPVVLKKTFQGKEYLVLKITYEEEVGKDIWYFYFDPFTYAMEVYQFFHDESQNDGEYILLDGLEEVNGMKIPKKRSWYTNKENRLLGTDLLTSNKNSN